MKKLVMAFVLITGIQTTVEAQKVKFVKVSKDVRKDARKLEKEGWDVVPGELPINQQLNNTYEKQMAEDDSGMPKFLVGTGVSIGSIQSAAEMQALELSKLNILNIMESNIKSVISTDLSNNQISNTEAASVSKTLQVALSKVSKKLQYTRPILKLYREKGGLVEVRMLIAYNFEMVRKMIHQEVLFDETNNLRKAHEKYFNPEKLNNGTIRNSDEQP